MFTKEEIIARLAAGETSDTIAQEMTDLLNGAIDEVNQKEAKELALKEKTADYNDFANAMTYYITHYTDIKDFAAPTMEEFDELISYSTVLFTEVENAINEFANIVTKTKEKSKSKTKTKIKSFDPDKIIAEFIDTLK